MLKINYVIKYKNIYFNLRNIYKKNLIFKIIYNFSNNSIPLKIFYYESKIPLNLYEK